MTFHYLSGTEIIIKGLSFVCPRPTRRYVYSWVTFDRHHLTESLAKFMIKNEDNEEVDMLTEVCKLENDYLPAHIYFGLDKYSAQRIEYCKNLNKLDYSLAEQWYKQAMDYPKLFKFNSPNKKTKFEYYAEKRFEKDCQSCRLQPNEQPITEEQLAFLMKYAKAYGIEVPTFGWRINTRKTDHGYTEEPEMIVQTTQSDINRSTYSRNSTTNLPKYYMDNVKTKYHENSKFIKQAYENLKWIMEHDKDDSFLMDGYHRCPVCGEIFHETVGCEGHIEPLTYLNADNMFYGISSTYEDYESTKDYYERELD